MSDKAIGVYRVPGDPNPWEQDGPPWLDGWDTVGPVPQSTLRLPMWTERDLGIGRPRPGYYQTVAEGLGALLRECGRMHEAGNTTPATPATTDKPWHGPWEWKKDADDGLYAWVLDSGRDSDAPFAVWAASGGTTYVWEDEHFDWRSRPTLADALAHIRSVSADPVPDPPAEVWEMCGEKAPSGWRRVGGLWTYGDDDDTAPGFILRRGRSASDAWCAEYGLPPLPDAACVQKGLPPLPTTLDR